MPFIQDFKAGFLYPYRAFATIARHGYLARPVIVLALLNLLLFVAVFAAGLVVIGPRLANLIVDLVPGNSWYLDILHFMLVVVSWMFLLTGLFFLFVILSAFAGSALYDLLSERTERLAGVEAPQIKGFAAQIRLMFRSLFGGVRSLANLLLVYLFLAPLNLVPGIGSVAYAVLATTYACRRLAMEFLGFPMDRRGYTYRQKIEHLKRHRAAAMGFGSGILILLSVPLVNVVAVPAGVVGATLMFCETGKANDRKEQPSV